MNLSAHPQSSPLRLLLVLEWALLGVAFMIQILVSIAYPNSGFLLLNELGTIAFASMRWAFPQRRSYKLLFIASEIGLLLLLTFAGKFSSPALLYVVLVIRNCELLKGNDSRQRKLRSAITIFAFTTCMLSQAYRVWYGQLPVKIAISQFWPIWIGFLIILGLVFLFLQLLVDTVLSERKGQEQLADANTQLRRYAMRVEELATVQERNRIARDIHDSLGHSLTIFNIHLEAALRLLHSEPTEAEALLLEAKQLGTQALQDIRASVTVLRSDPLQGRSLAEAIAQMVADFQRTTGIVPSCTLEIGSSLDGELNAALYRLVQESLTNICKHAAATAVAIGIRQSAPEIQASEIQAPEIQAPEIQAPEIQVIIQDNGRGFELGDRALGFGLQGMQERTLAMGGTLNIKTAPGQGCHIHAVFPVNPYDSACTGGRSKLNSARVESIAQD